MNKIERLKFLFFLIFFSIILTDTHHHKVEAQLTCNSNAYPYIYGTQDSQVFFNFLDIDGNGRTVIGGAQLQISNSVKRPLIIMYSSAGVIDWAQTYSLNDFNGDQAIQVVKFQNLKFEQILFAIGGNEIELAIISSETGQIIFNHRLSTCQSFAFSTQGILLDSQSNIYFGGKQDSSSFWNLSKIRTVFQQVQLYSKIIEGDTNGMVSSLVFGENENQLIVGGFMTL